MPHSIALRILATLLATNLCLLTFPSDVCAVVLVADGRPNAKIFVPAAATPAVQAAAADLSRVLRAMSGADLPVVAADSAQAIGLTQPAIVLGELAAELGLKMDKSSRARDGFRHRLVGEQLLIVGESPQGVVHGVYDFLERLGCGWYAPGSVGEVIPRRTTVTVEAPFDFSEVSDSINRRFWYGGKNGVGAATAAWLNRNRAEHQVGSWNHAWHGLVNPKDHLKDHPEYFSLNRGQRTARQLCTTNPDTLRLAAEALERRMAEGSAVIYAAGPNDGGNLCECETCGRLDTPGYREPTSGKPSCADRVFGFANQLAEITSRRFPDKDLGVLVYSEYSRPPLKFDVLHPNVFPMVAPIRRCRFHGPGNPNCPSSQLLDQEIVAWGKLNKKLGFYVYNYNLADTLVPLGKIGYYKRLMSAARRAGAEETAWIFETIDSWSMHAPHMYLSARLAWDSRRDIDREMERYFQGFYGEAAEPMRRYWNRVDQAYETTPAHTGSQYGLHRIWTAELLAASRADVDQALRAARDPRTRQAVAMADAGLRCAEIFSQIWKNIGECQFLEADEGHAQLKRHVAEMAKQTDPNWVHDRYALGYFQRFVGLTVDAGAAALGDGGQLVARLGDVWKFKKDEQGRGGVLGWGRADHDDRDWSDFATFSRTWDDQGLGDYQGDAWYRTTFTLPEKQLPDGDLRLWFGGFDYNVDVHLNGERLGGWSGFAKPAEFTDVGRHLKPGKNQIAVRVSAGDLGELGTGGLMMPVMIYRWNGKSKMPEGKKGVEYEQ